LADILLCIVAADSATAATEVVVVVDDDDVAAAAATCGVVVVVVVVADAAGPGTKKYVRETAAYGSSLTRGVVNVTILLFSSAGRATLGKDDDDDDDDEAEADAVVVAFVVAFVDATCVVVAVEMQQLLLSLAVLILQLAPSFSTTMNKDEELPEWWSCWGIECAGQRLMLHSCVDPLVVVVVVCYTLLSSSLTM
jgi:hypothetical protein